MNPLYARLASLRRRLRFVVTFRGACWSATVVLVACAFAGVLDWKFHLPALVRAVLLVGTLTAAGVVAYRALLRPLLVRTDNLSLALRVEDAYPDLNDSLASAVQFLEQSRRGGQASGGGLESSILRLEAVRRTMRLLDGIDFRRAVSARGVGPAGLMATCATALVALLVIADPALALTALERLALPFGGKDWPRQTQIVEVVYKARAARGEAYAIRAKLAGLIPDSASIVFEGITPSRQSQDPRKRSGDNPEMNLRLDRVDRSFRFKVEANDAVTKWYDVTVLPPPVLVPLDGRASPQVSLTYPAYTDLPSEDLPEGNGNIEAVFGTHVRLRAAVDRPVAKAWIEYQADQPLVNLAALAGFVGTHDAGNILTRAAAVHLVRERVPVALDPTGRYLQVDFVPCVRGMYALHFEDDTGLGNARLFELRMMLDPAPSVAIERPSPAHDSLSLLADAEISVRVAAQDPQFAVRSAHLQYRVKRGAEVGPVRQIHLYDHASAGKAIPSVLSLFAAAPIPAPAPPLRLRPTRVEHMGRLGLAALRHADGQPLREGDIVIVQAAADDFDDVNPFKGPGLSNEVELHIIGRADLDAALNRAQVQIQEDLTRLQKEQQDAINRVIAAEQRWRNTGKLRPEEIDQVLQAEQIQQQIRNKVGDRNEGLRAEVARIQQSLKDNKLPRAGVHDRMEAVANELDRLVRDHLEQIEPKLTNARKENEAREGKTPPRKNEKGDLAEARRHQEEVENAFQDLLKQLEPWGSISAVKGETKALLQEQRRLQDDVRNAGKDTAGKDRTALTPDQRAALDRAAELQRKLGERTGQLLDKIQRAAEERKEKEPELADALKQALNKGKEGGAQDKMREAAQDIRDNKVASGGEKQKAAAQALEQMANELDERREQELDRLRKKLDEAEDKLKELGRDQEELRKKVKEARQIADPKKREQELKRLAEKQAKLKKDADELGKELKRLNANQAARALQGAGEEMERAARQLQDNGGEADPRQEEALNRLQEAREKLNDKQDNVEEQLAREKLAKVAEQLKGLRERQESALKEGDRLRTLALQHQQWRRAQLFSLGELAESEHVLGKETRTLATEKLKEAKVFSRVLERAADAMDQASVRLKDVRANPGENLTDGEGARLQREALRRLDQLLEALKQEQARGPGGNAGGGQGGGGGGGNGGAGPPQDGIPQMAQLKALRALQQEVNERTETFGRDHPDAGNLTPPELRELLGIRKDQQDVADLLDELTVPAEEPAPEKKPAEKPAGESQPETRSNDLLDSSFRANGDGVSLRATQ